MKSTKFFLIKVFLGVAFLAASCSSEDVSDGTVSQNDSVPENPSNPNPPDSTPPDDDTSAETGLPVITIEGAISNEEAQTIIDRDGGSLTTWILINNTTELTSIDLSAFTSLENRLVIFNNQDLEEVLLPNLENVADQIQIQVNPVLSTLRLPVLVSTGVLEITQNPALEEIRLDRLETIDRISFNIVGNSNTTVDFPELRTVGQEIFIAESNLRYANFPNLETIEGRLLFTSGSVETIDFTALDEIQELSISDIDLLEEISFPQLSSLTGFVSGDSQLGNFSISACVDLISINLPAMQQFTGNHFLIQENSSLTEANFTVLTSVDADFTFRNNNSIQNVTFPALTTISGELKVHNNAALIALDLGALEQVGLDIEITNSYDITLVDFDRLSSVREILFVLNVGNEITGEVDFRLSAIQEVDELFVNKFVPEANVELFLASLVNKNPNIQNLSIDVKGSLSTTSEGYVQSLEANGNSIRIYN